MKTEITDTIKGEGIEKRFQEIVALNLKAFAKPRAEMLASCQLMRDILAGEIDRAEGLEFLIEQEILHGVDREAASLHYQNLLAARIRPAQDMGAAWAAFHAEVAARHSGGLPLGQAEHAACLQLVRDARLGKMNPHAVRDIIIEIECENGRSRAVAEAHADAVLAGKQSDWKRPNIGYSMTPARKPRPRRIQDEAPLSEYLSQMANQASMK